MKKLFFPILFLAAGSLILQAKEVPESLARQAAMNFIRQHYSTLKLAPSIPGEISLCFTKEGRSTSIDQPESNRALYYVFEYQSKPGFIIISGDDRAVPVLGYSNESGFIPDSLHPEIRKWLENYTGQIRYVIDNDLPASEPVREQWEALKQGRQIKSFSAMQTAGPLCTTQWNQSPYYNQFCPYDAQRQERCVTGCVATAMAQIMKFWNYPAQGEGFHSFNHESFGTLSANFGGEKYAWTSMPNKITSANTYIATLMYHCGISVDMRYGVGSAGGSSAYMITAASPVQHCSEYALENYFSYDKSLEGVKRENYTDPNWINLLKTELNAGRPVLYAGFGSGGGHCFVCDGYNGEYFHMNWGWGGAYDGFFLISALNPTGVGTGGGTGGFNSGHQAVIGIKPPSGQGGGQTATMVVYANLTVSANPVLYGDGFTVHTDFANAGNTDFTGDYCVAIFDKDVNFVDFVQILTGYNLAAGYHYTNGLDFKYNGSFTLLPGSYYLAAFYKTASDNWILAGDYDVYKNLATLDVKQENDLELYADFQITGGNEITQGKPFTVHFDVANYGSSNFDGILDVSLYTLEGDFAETIYAWEDASLDAGYHYTNGIDFSTDGVKVEPGTYLMALQYYTTTTDWQLAGSTYHTNPVKFIVKAAPVIQDPYEPNNSRETAYLIQPVYQNNSARIVTTGSTIHAGQDYDFYGIKLEGGYKYTVNARVHDAYNSGDGNTYTDDVLVSLLVDTYTSDVYDDVMPPFIITAYGSGNAYFYVAPYFTGEMGSYLLEINITRVYGTGIETLPLNGDLVVWPNPAGGELNLNLENHPVNRIRIINPEGRIMRDIQTVDQPVGARSIPVQDLRPGMYIVEVISNDKVFKQRFIKSTTR